MEKTNQNTLDLIEQIKDKIGKPVSIHVVEATIESFGIREEDTQEDFGFQSITTLASHVFTTIYDASDSRELKNSKERETEIVSPIRHKFSDYIFEKAKIFIQYYTLGIFHLLPVLIQIATIIVFGFSLWTFVGFNEIQSTAVVLGVVVGLISTGGFIQVIGRQASFYWNYQDYHRVEKTINYLLKIGIVSIFTVLVLIFIVNFFFHLYPYELLLIVFVYAFLIGVLVLTIAPFHTIKKRWAITVSIALGTLSAGILKEKTSISIYYVHWIGIGVALLFARTTLYLYLKKLVRNTSTNSGKDINIPVFIYHNYQYFFYGLLIYFFIFIDRILAWSAGEGASQPFMVYFEKKYELGMDFAIMVYLMLAGVLEYGIASFTRFMDIGQKVISASNPEQYSGHIRKMYWQQVLLLFITGCIAFFLIFELIDAAWGFKAKFNHELSRLSFRVFLIGGSAYLFLAWGILNALYLFTLGQVKKPLKALLYASLLNLVVGFVLSRMVGYEWSVVGLFAGSVLFLLITIKDTLRYFKNLDYHYYAAY
ncbi:MAG: hypothetical protein RLZZ500_1017 [Bacteroidota bacterium]|jgi:hypothetical protein